MIESAIVTAFHFRREYIIALSKLFLDGGHIFILGGYDRGHAAEDVSGCPNT